MQNGRLKGWERKFDTHTVPECFCVVCIVLLNQYVPLSVTSDGFFLRFSHSCCLKPTNGNEPNISALDTVTVKGREEMESSTHQRCGQ